MLDRVGYAGELDTVGLSEQLWRGIDLRDMLVRPNYGTAEFDHFTSPSVTLTGRSTLTQATTGTFAMLDENLGVARAASASTTNNQGLTSVQMQQASTGARHSVPSSGRVCFEARVRTTGSGTPGKLFVGLAPWNTAILSSGALTTSTQYIGFNMLGTLTLTCTSRKSSSTTANTASLGAMVDSTWIKLGILIENASKASVWVNGVRLDTLTTNVHDGFCIPTFACVSAGTTSPTLDIDWYALAVQNLTQ